MLRFSCYTTPCPSQLVMSDQLKIEITHDPSFVKALDDLAARVGKTQMETVRDALIFYDNAVTQLSKQKVSSANDERNRLIDELQEVTKQFVEVNKELYMARETRDKAIEKERDASRKAKILGEKQNQLTFDLQNFFLRLHSTESMQGEEQ